jgi:hypothetical protein
VRGGQTSQTEDITHALPASLTILALASITPLGTWRPRLLSSLACSHPTTGTPVQSNTVPRARPCWTYGPGRNQDKPSVFRSLAPTIEGQTSALTTSYCRDYILHRPLAPTMGHTRAEGQPVISSLNGDSHRVPRPALLHGQLRPPPCRIRNPVRGMNFQATGNDYLMRLTNREELHTWCQAGSVPVAAAHVATTPTPASTDAAGPSAPRRRRRSSQHSRQARSERRHVERVASQHDAPTGVTVAAPVGECSASGPCFPIGLHGATTAYVANTNANATMRRVPPGRHVLVARCCGESRSFRTQTMRKDKSSRTKTKT